MITHVVQAKAFGLGWVDYYPAPSFAEAAEAGRLLLESKTAWMPGEYKREVRVVPVSESRCAAMYPEVQS